MINVTMLNNKIKNSGYKVSYIADQLNLKRNGLRNKLNGDTEFYASEIQKLSDLLDLSKKEREDIFLTKRLLNRQLIKKGGFMTVTGLVVQTLLCILIVTLLYG